MNPFTVVCPVHNEEELIPRTIPSIYDLKPNEVVFVLDKCTDKSLKLIECIHRNHGHETTLQKLFVYEDVDYRYRPAYLRRLAYKESSNDIIFNTSCDFILDPTLVKHRKHIDEETKIIKLGFLDYPPTLKSFLRRLYSTLTPWKSTSGLYFFSREAWKETENPETLKTAFSEDAHLIKAIESKYKSKYFNTRTLHLRPNETDEYDQQRGENYSQVLNVSPLRALLTSIFMLRPHLLVSYIRTRRQNN